LLTCSAATQADDWRATAGWVSDYRVRGLSLSNRQPAATLDLNLRGDGEWGLGFGAAALNRDSENRRSLFSASASQGWQLDADWRADLGLSHGVYPGSGYRPAYKTDELTATLAWRGRLNATLLATPNATRWDAQTGQPHSGRGLGLELNGRWRLVGPVALDAGLGCFTLQADGARRSYPYASIGLAATLGPLQAYLSQIGSRARQQGFAGAQRAQPAWVASLLWSF
jgi:uncharacterized protein (TIGR02001 family)